LVVKIFSKEAPSLTSNSLIEFSKDISKGKESLAMESFGFTFSHKDDYRCESLFLKHGFESLVLHMGQVCKMLHVLNMSHNWNSWFFKLEILV
jgi:hypothetical protein